MRKADIFFKGIHAGVLEEIAKGTKYRFVYDSGYSKEPVSLTMPITRQEYLFDKFPAFFDGLLPEGPMLEGLLKRSKIDRDDMFSQLVAVGLDMVGAVTAEELL